MSSQESNIDMRIIERMSQQTMDLTGDAFVRVASDPESGAMTYRLVRPTAVREVHLDHRGEVVGYTIADVD